MRRLLFPAALAAACLASGTAAAQATRFLPAAWTCPAGGCSLAGAVAPAVPAAPAAIPSAATSASAAPASGWHPGKYLGRVRDRVAERRAARAGR